MREKRNGRRGIEGGGGGRREREGGRGVRGRELEKEKGIEGGIGREGGEEEGGREGEREGMKVIWSQEVRAKSGMSRMPGFSIL